MASNLLIAYNQLFTKAKALSSINSFDNFSLTLLNYMAGERWCYGGVDSNISGLTIATDLGTGVTLSLDYMIIAGTSKLKADSTGTDIYIRGSSDNSTYTTLIGTNNLNTCTLIGDSPDVLIKSGLNNDHGSLPSTAYRWFNTVGSGASGNNRWILSKIYAGMFFDMGLDPDSCSPSIVTPSPHGFQFPTGNIAFSKLEYPRAQYEIVWKNITDAKVETFFSEIVRNPLSNYVFLHTTSHHAVLENRQLVHCQVIDAKTQNLAPDLNEVRATFREVRG